MKPLLFSMGVLGICLTTPAATTTQPATQPATHPAIRLATQPAPDPVVQRAEGFLKGLETFLDVERKDRRKAETILDQLGRDVSDQTLDNAAKFGWSPRKFLAAWGSMINFYAGDIRYDKIRAMSIPGPPPAREPQTVIVIFPAGRDKRAIYIYVTIVREDTTWKVNLIRLVPKTISSQIIP